ncbi:MAG: hypothetical protein HQL69_16870 [Magnetococcales bacterium]|nr:hypothetical protein [Magnetococcales bacterium]
MQPVIQEEKTGCAIASAANIAGISYSEAKKVANSLGIYAEDSALWSQTTYICRILNRLKYNVNNSQTPFTTWKALPDCALLAIKWHMENNRPFWHWVVFVRKEGVEYVLDSKKSLKSNIRKDFGRIKPKWYMEVTSN